MKIISIIMLLFLALISGCEHPIGAELSHEFELKYGREAYIEEESLKIFFAAVPEDSRCPLNSMCDVEGNAKVVLDIKKGYDRKVDTLNTHSDDGCGNYPHSFSFLDYEITLTALNPGRVHPERVNPDAYIATLLVKKNELIIKGGTSFGFCGGYCKTEIEIINGYIKFARSSWDPENYPEKSMISNINLSEWDDLADEVNIETLARLEDIYGCPDCADGGAEWIEIINKDFYKKIVFEHGKTLGPIKGLIEKVRVIRNRFEEKLPR